MSVEITGVTQTQNVLNTCVSNETKRRILSKLSKAVVDNSKKRVRAQTDLSGAAWTPRKSGKRKKMLVKIGQRIQTVSVNPNEAIIGFSNPLVSRVAAIHQKGIDQQGSVEQLRRRDRNPITDSTPATIRQANALLNVGFKIRKQGGGFKTPTKRWITNELSMKQAGAILRSLRDQVEETWIIPIPERPFLGVPDNELESLATLAMNELTREINQ